MGASFEDSKINLTPSETQAWDREEFLVQARLLLGVVCVSTICLDPGCLGGDADISALLILLYFTFCVGNVVAVGLDWHYGTLWITGLHVADIVMVSLITMLTGGIHSTFLGLYLFVLLAGACKWGFKGALLTSCACVCLVLTFLTLASRRPVPPILIFGGTPIAASIVLSAGLIAAGCLLGVVVEREQRRAEDELVIAWLVRGAMPQPSFREALGSTLTLLRQYFDADQVRLALQELKGDQVVAWDVTRETGKDQEGVRSWTVAESVGQASFAMPSEDLGCFLGIGRANGESKLGGDRSRLKRSTPGPLGRGRARISPAAKQYDGVDDVRMISEEHAPFGSAWSMLSTSFAFEGKWLGRLTVYNPRTKRSRPAGIRFLESLVREVGPAILDKFKVARLRTRAQARERVRLVQELHDGIVQSLIGLELQMNHLRRTQMASPDPGAAVEELARLEALLHGEIAAVREEMQRIKPLQVEPSRFIEYLARTVDKFQRDQGITARFLAEPMEVALPPRVCTELVRIVQEALVNVRKHSGAHKVLVSFGRSNGNYKLFVEDDGRGFEFAGMLSAAQLEASSQCPMIVRERVRAIGGELVIESSKASGARLEILVPVTAHGRVSSNS